jgi:hypothetical protein
VLNVGGDEARAPIGSLQIRNERQIDNVYSVIPLNDNHRGPGGSAF